MSERGRVVFLLKLKPGASEQFLEAYEGVRHEVAEGVKGHIVDQVCQSREDEDSWLITSEWDSIDDFLAWEATQEHRDQAKPMRDTFAEATSYKYVVREETRNPERAA
jgi:heme oxygenase (mycobilin-producing)